MFLCTSDTAVNCKTILDLALYPLVKICSDPMFPLRSAMCGSTRVYIYHTCTLSYHAYHVIFALKLLFIVTHDEQVGPRKSRPPVHRRITLIKCRTNPFAVKMSFAAV